MIRYRYVEHIKPPAPFVNVSVRCPKTGAVAPGVPAQLDTAADRTILPAEVVTALGLVARHTRLAECARIIQIT
jgi:hypothetical protein